jgi:hypothetical protein
MKISRHSRVESFMLSRKVIEFSFSAVIVLFLAWVLWEPKNWPAPARLFPWSLGFSVLALALVQLVVAGRAVIAERKTNASLRVNDKLPEDTAGARGQHLVAGKAPGVAANSAAWATPAPGPAGSRAVTLCVWLVAFYLVIWLLGFKIGSFFLTLAFLKFTAREKWPISAAMALGAYLFLWLVFDIGLKLPLDNGILADLFTD